MQSMVDKNLEALAVQENELKGRARVVESEVETMQQRRRTLAYPARVSRSIVAIEELTKVDARLKELAAEEEILQYAIEEIAHRKVAEEARRAEVERLEAEYAAKEQVRFGACEQMEAAIETLVPLVAAYLDANAGQYALATKLEHSDAAKHRHVAQRVYNFLATRLRPLLRHATISLPTYKINASLTAYERSRDLTLAKPALAAAPDPEFETKEEE